MKITLKRDIDESLKNDWIYLEKNNSFFIFQTLLWNLSWLKENHKQDDILIVTVHDKENPVIIFPFCVVKKFNFKILKWIGHDISDYLGPLINKKYKLESILFTDIWDSIIKLIKKECDYIFLDKQTNENFFSNNPIVKYLNCKKYDETYGINLTKWDELKKYKNKSLQKFRWSKKKLLEIGNLEFVKKIESDDEKKVSIKKIIDWKKNKKNNLNFSKSFSDKFYLNFINDNNITISGLKLNKNFIALSLGYEKNENYLYLVPSYKGDDDLIRFSPGKILMIELIDYFESQKFKYFDFCDGKETYKENWTNNKVDLFKYTKSTNFFGIVLNFLLKIKKI